MWKTYFFRSALCQVLLSLFSLLYFDGISGVCCCFVAKEMVPKDVEGVIGLTANYCDILLSNIM